MRSLLLHPKWKRAKIHPLLLALPPILELVLAVGDALVGVGNVLIERVHLFRRAKIELGFGVVGFPRARGVVVALP